MHSLIFFLVNLLTIQIHLELLNCDGHANHQCGSVARTWQLCMA